MRIPQIFTLIRYNLDEATYGILQKKGEKMTFTVKKLDGKVLLKQVFDLKKKGSIAGLR